MEGVQRRQCGWLCFPDRQQKALEAIYVAAGCGPEAGCGCSGSWLQSCEAAKPETDGLTVSDSVWPIAAATCVRRTGSARAMSMLRVTVVAYSDCFQIRRLLIPNLPCC
jgi:hypothetical protein